MALVPRTDEVKKKFPVGREVLVALGPYEGRTGKVIDYYDRLRTALVNVQFYRGNDGWMLEQPVPLDPETIKLLEGS